jgi:FKBP-type peptidyl-prolyl cis-trans isomerase
MLCACSSKSNKSLTDEQIKDAALLLATADSSAITDSYKLASFSRLSVEANTINGSGYFAFKSPVKCDTAFAVLLTCEVPRFAAIVDSLIAIVNTVPDDSIVRAFSTIGGLQLVASNSPESKVWEIAMPAYTNTRGKIMLTAESLSFLANLLKESLDENGDLKSAHQLAKLDNFYKSSLDKRMIAMTDTMSGVVKTPSGFRYKVIKEGEGTNPTVNDEVTIAYKGTLIDGSVFYQNDDESFRVDGVIPGFADGLKLMKPGASYIFYIPSSLGYGTAGIPGMIAPDQPLIFEVTLKNFEPINK